MTVLFAFLLAQVATPAPAPAAPPLTTTWPARIEISAPSATTFARFNHEGFGSILVGIKCDGTKTPIIPPTPDIDADLKAVLMHFVDAITVTAGKDCETTIYLVRFEVPSGSVTEVELPPPPG
ncbi:MAG TPA: hypothetical protein VFO29_01835 [Candidatus Rubrimentiphilum sp.]|nr:hypothetical protein [Candidatus Rubrimentiphilum sp.]